MAEAKDGIRPGLGGGVFLPGRVMLASVLAALLMVGVHALVIYPAYRNGIVDDTVQEALRDGAHIRRAILGLHPFAGAAASDELRAEVGRLAEDFLLVKMRLFDAAGRIVLSTERGEEGTVNTKAYFREQVARGESVSKVVWSGSLSAEGQGVGRDVVEVYLPIMAGGGFVGACEIYYDVTARKAAIDRNFRRSLAITGGGALLMLAAVGALALRARREAREQQRLQEQLIRSDRLAALGTLVGGIAHEFNNINVSVLGFSELALEQGDLAPGTRDFLARIHRAAQRARAITTNLLDFSRVDRGVFAPTPLGEPVRAALDLVRSAFEKEGVRFEVRIDPVPPSLLDPDLMTQVFLNLLTNARHALLDRPTPFIRIAVAARAGLAVATIADNGCGIPPSQLTQVFTPFFSTKGEHGRGGEQARVKGTGLGLSVCHTIVRGHRGEILAESVEGLGTTFAVRLPAADAAGGAGA